MKALTIILLLVSGMASAQSLVNNPISSNGGPPNGLNYDHATPHPGDLEIHFRFDPAKLAASQMNGYGCTFTPYGFWLFDEYNINTYTGNRMITMSRNGDLCAVFRPQEGGRQDVRFTNVQLDGSINVLSFVNNGSGYDVTLNGVTDTVNGTMTFQSGSNGIGVGHEVNGYHNWWTNESFPGDVCYLNDNGRFPLTESGSSLVGTASFGPACGTPPPPPVFACEDGLDNDGDGLIDMADPGCDSPTDDDETDPTACELDPNSFECACETNGNAWVECTSCVN